MKHCTVYHDGSDKSDFCCLLDAYLMDRFAYKSSCAACSPLDTNIIANRKKFDLYIRIFERTDTFWGGKALVISRIGFDKPRQGHGTNLLKLLVNFARERQYEVIGIEQAGTPSIQAFAERYGFMRMEGTNHFTASVQQLAV